MLLRLFHDSGEANGRFNMKMECYLCGPDVFDGFPRST